MQREREATIEKNTTLRKSEKAWKAYPQDVNLPTVDEENREKVIVCVEGYSLLLDEDTGIVDGLAEAVDSEDKMISNFII
jgi:hypothetical protein